MMALALDNKETNYQTDLVELQIGPQVISRIWTQITVSISYDNNCKVYCSNKNFDSMCCFGWFTVTYI